MAFLEEYVGDVAGRGADYQSGYLSDLTVCRSDRVTSADGHLAVRDGVIADRVASQPRPYPRPP